MGICVCACEWKGRVGDAVKRRASEFKDVDVWRCLVQRILRNYSVTTSLFTTAARGVHINGFTIYTTTTTKKRIYPRHCMVI